MRRGTLLNRLILDPRPQIKAIAIRQLVLGHNDVEI